MVVHAAIAERGDRFSAIDSPPDFDVAFNFKYQGFDYHCTASRDGHGRVAEIFLTTSKVGSAAQQHAECAAILASLALQYGVSAETLIRSVGGAVGRALELAVTP